MPSIIYKLQDKNGLVYFGSTRQRLYQRFAEHRYRNHKRPSTSKLLDHDSMEVSILEEYDCIEPYNETFIKTRERYYIENFECVNKRVPLRTQKERTELKKEQEKENTETETETVTSI